MLLTELDYSLPPGLIAQEPARPRDSSRLLVVHRGQAGLGHRRFSDLPDLLSPGDLMLFNQTKVLAARLHARRRGTGGRVEVLLLEETEPGRWEALVSPGRRTPVGTELVFEGGLAAQVTGRSPVGTRELSFRANGDLHASLERIGQTPLPPYIHSPVGGHGVPALQPSDYQTVYARVAGSSAAPTAGLHFTPRVLEALQERGVRAAFLTLHIGLDTFRPVRTEPVEDHQMHSERFHLPPETADQINRTRSAGGRLVAVGTSTVRAVETCAGEDGRVSPGQGRTALFITPGYRFRVVDALLTNFHLPHTTLLALVSAFAGGDLIRRAYREAVGERYRFLSFGDAMLIV